MALALQAHPIAPPGPARPAAFRCVACGLSRSEPHPVLTADPEQRPFDLVRCPACRLVQQHPRQPPGRLAAHYGADYYVFNESEPQRWARAVQQYVLHLLPHESSRPRRLLDVGSGPGHLAALARRRGWRVIALDISPHAVSRAAVRFGLDARAGTLAQYRSTLPPFDFVFLGDLIEHVPEPRRLLEDVRAVLSPRGLLSIDTPNWASLWRRIGRARWLGLNRYHVNLFDARSLGALLERCGFTRIQTGSYTHYRYESLAARPEPRAWLHRLPGALAWRVHRLMNRFARAGDWAALHHHPPTTLDEAHSCVDATAQRRSFTRSRHAADNLIATASRT